MSFKQQREKKNCYVKSLLKDVLCSGECKGSMFCAVPLEIQFMYLGFFLTNNLVGASIKPNAK